MGDRRRDTSFPSMTRARLRAGAALVATALLAVTLTMVGGGKAEATRGNAGRRAQAAPLVATSDWGEPWPVTGPTDTYTICGDLGNGTINEYGNCTGGTWAGKVWPSQTIVKPGDHFSLVASSLAEYGEGYGAWMDWNSVYSSSHAISPAEDCTHGPDGPDVGYTKASIKLTCEYRVNFWFPPTLPGAGRQAKWSHYGRNLSHIFGGVAPVGWPFFVMPGSGNMHGLIRDAADNVIVAQKMWNTKMRRKGGPPVQLRAAMAAAEVARALSFDNINCPDANRVLDMAMPGVFNTAGVCPSGNLPADTTVNPPTIEFGNGTINPSSSGYGMGLDQKGGFVAIGLNAGDWQIEFDAYDENDKITRVKSPFVTMKPDNVLSFVKEGLGEVTAGFNVAAVAGTPGKYRFTSTSSDSTGKPLTHKWTFGDGGTGTGSVIEHTYAKPGTFPVKLDVDNGVGGKATLTKSVEVKAPQLSMSIALADDALSSLEPGDVADVEVKVTASDGLGNLSGLSFAGGKLTSADTSKLAVNGSLAPGGTFALAPKASKTFTTEVEAKKTGTVELTGTVNGKDVANNPVSLTGHGDIKIRSSVLALELTLDKPELTLEEDEHGPKKQTVKLTVKATNTSDDDVTDVKLLSIQPSWQEGLPFTSVFPSSILKVLDGPGPDGMELGDIASKKFVEKVFNVEVKDDGHLRLSTDATYVDAEGTNGFSTGEVKLLSKPKYMLEFHAKADASTDDNAAEPWNGPNAVGVRRRLLIDGGVKNLTTDQRIIATIPSTGVKYLSSTQLDKLEEDWEQPSMPFRVSIDPGSSQGVHAMPTAIPVPGRAGVLTFAEVGYEPRGKSQLTGDDDELKAIDPKAILKTDEQSKFKVEIAWPPPEPAPSAIELYGLFSKAFIESSAAWWVGAAGAVGDALYAVGEMEVNAWNVISGDPVAREALRQKLVGAWASFVHTIELFRETLAAMSPAEKAQLIVEITNPMLLFLKVGRAIVTSEDAQKATKAIAAAINTAWTRITTLGGEDPRELARILGSGSATVFNEITVGMVTDAALAKLVARIRFGKNLDAAQKFVDDAAAAKAADGLKIDKGLKGIPAGAALTDEVLTIGLGITRAEKAQLQAVAKRFNLVVMARSRGAEAAELIQKGLARLKPFGIDAKNVNDIDRLLGFPAALKDTVAIKKPLAWEKVLASSEYKVLDAEQRAQVAARWQTRSKEWSGAGKLKESSPGEWVVSEHPGTGIGAERQKFLDAAEKGSFDLQFPTKGNWEEVATDGKAIGTAKADFSIKHSVDEAGDEIIQPFMSDAAGGKPLPITGDVDLVALLNPDGTYPDPRKIIEAYAELAKPPLRMQHPATWSFNVQGKSMDLLADHVLGGATAEPLAAFGPLGDIKAVLFDPKMSLIPADRAANPALLITIAGGIKLPSHAYGLGALVPWALGTPRNTKPYYVPETWEESLKRGPGTGKSLRAIAPSTAGVLFDRSSAPVELAQQGKGLVMFGTNGWAAWDPVTPGQLHVAPQTPITDDLKAGQKTVGIYSMAKQFENGGTGGQEWFSVGDTVTVDLSGEPWTTKVAALTANSITFTDGAPRAYLAGTAIHLRAAATVPTDPGDGSGPGVNGGELPRTGSDVGSPAAIGFLLVVAGAIVLGMSRRADRTRRRPA